MSLDKVLNELKQEIFPLLIGQGLMSLQEKLNLVFKQNNAIASHAGMKMICKDAAGEELQEGDFLETTDKSKKKVMEVGLHCVKLSTTSDEKEVDGWWSEDEITNERKWKKLAK